MNKTPSFLFLSALSLAFHIASAQVITFTGDSMGPKLNGFSSSVTSFVTFADTLGEDLYVQDFGAQSHGNAIAAFRDDASAIRFGFGGTVDFLSFEFGNDDPSYSNPGDLASLSVYLGGSLVGSQSVLLNRNDLMDQSISFSGALFDSAIFQYQVSTDGLIEIIDNVEFRQANAIPAPVIPVPEPGTYGLMGAGALMATAWFRRRRNLKNASRS